MARAMSDRDLRHGEPFHPQECRQKPVHSVIETNPIQTFAAECFEGASRVGNEFLADIIPHRVGDSGGETARPRIPPNDPAPHHRIEGSNLLQQQQDVGWIVLQVRVHGDHDISAG